MKIDIGAGKNKKPGFIGIDFVQQEGVDIMMDVTKMPLPFKDNEVEEVWSYHTFEHLDIDGIEY